MYERAINLTFHGIGGIERPLDPGEEETWLSKGQFVSVLESVGQRSDVRLTFDDGNASDLEHALPELRRRGLTAAFFVVAGRLGTHGFLDEYGVRALRDAGMRIGCHGMLHRPWRRLDRPARDEELVDAKRILEAVVERPVTEAACPFGAYDREVLRSLRRSGYRRVYTSDRGSARPSDWLQARNTVGPDSVNGGLERILSHERQLHDALARRAKLAVKRWR